MTKLPAEFLARPLAHRGLHDVSRGVPENSRAAFQAAIDGGYGIEMDVQRSADGQAMVFHDYDLARLTGQTGPVAQRGAAELGAIPLTGGTGTIPTLAEVLHVVSGRAPLLIEIKDQDGAMGENVGPLEQAVAAALATYDGAVALMSFNPHSVAALARFAPDRPRGLVTDPFTATDWPLLPAATRDRLRDIPDYDRLGCSFVSHNHIDLACDRIGELRRNGAHILCWTIKSARQEADARKVAHNITFEGYRPAP